MKENMRVLGYKYAGPVLVSYVRWILSECSRKGIERIYFLARDGYTLKCIAEKLCEKYNIAIECRYLYCSRNSLRTPSYHLIGEEAFQILLLPSASNTVDSILKRISFSEDEIDRIMEEISVKDRKKVLSDAELQQVCSELQQGSIFRSLVELKSKEAYGKAIGYFEQEGLLSDVKYAIADSGWTGSMQRSLRQLLQAAGFQGGIDGFYFGMYAEPKEAADGTYHTWYFDAKSAIADKVCFSNNLLECWLAAPHGMTVGYEKGAEGYEPVLLKGYTEAEKNTIITHFTGIMEYTDDFMNKNDQLSPYDKKSELTAMRKVLHRIMVHPTKEEAAGYGEMFFSDDVTESFGTSLASETQIRQLKEYLLVKRIFRKVMRRKVFYPANLFWVYGVIAFLPQPKRFWYCWNVKAWEYLRFWLQSKG